MVARRKPQRASPCTIQVRMEDEPHSGAGAQPWKLDEGPAAHVVHRRSYVVHSPMAIAQPDATLGNPDDISWKFMANGQHSANSAYHEQFQGSFADHDWTKLWATKVEGKCKMFCWLILQNILWTTDRIVKHGGTANPICQICHMYPETPLHLLSTCPYSKQVWQGLVNWMGMSLHRLLTHNYRKIKTWWSGMLGPIGQQTNDRT
jgi:hypothetical protein